jgi:multidrug efflux pump subunit AcrB
MADRQQALAQAILQDPAVESLSSFIGVYGTNTTVNSGRIQINLKPLEERKVSASEIIRRLQARLSQVDGITLGIDVGIPCLPPFSPEYVVEISSGTPSLLARLVPGWPAVRKP